MKEIPSGTGLPGDQWQSPAAPHRLSHKQAVGFFIFSVAAAALLVAWIFFINKGMVLVEEPLPLRVSIGGEEKMCGETHGAACAFKLSPKKYGAVFQKNGFFDDVQTVEVLRWQTVRVTPNFVFIPVVREIEKTAFPAANPPALPPVIKSSAFPSALVSGRLIFLNTAQEPHALKEWKNEQPVKLMEFERPLKNPVLFGAETAQRLLIQEENGFYLIDLEKRSRKKLDTLNLALAARWVGNMLIFEEAEGSIRKILWLHDDLQTREELPAETLENITALSPGVLVFLTSKKMDANAPRIGPSIEEALEEGRKEFEKNHPQTLFLTQFDIVKKSFHTLASIEIDGNETVTQLTALPAEKKLFFMKGEKAFEVVLEE